jgi:hypothetical protein
MDIYHLVKPKNTDTKFCWRKDSEKDLWDLYQITDLEREDERSLEVAAFIYQMCVNKEFREKKYNLFFKMFHYFFPQSYLFFEAIFEFYQSPSKLSDEKLALEIQNGLIDLLAKVIQKNYFFFLFIFFLK